MLNLLVLKSLLKCTEIEVWMALTAMVADSEIVVGLALSSNLAVRNRHLGA